MKYKKEKQLIKVAAGAPLTYGTLAFVGGKLPGAMGTTMTSALAPSVGMVGATSKIAMGGLAIRTMRRTFNPKQFKKLKGGKK